MKDFKKMPKMACGGGVKKYETGGSVLKDSYLAPAAPEGLKQAAAKKAFKEYSGDRKNWPLNPKEAAIRSVDAADEAEDEAKRESTRGIGPENRKKRGGKVTKRK